MGPGDGAAEGWARGMDEVGRIEADALRKTEVGDWPRARVLFNQALAHEMPPLRRAYILKSVALTYQREDNRGPAITTAEEAIRVLNSAGTAGKDAESLRNWLSLFIQDMSSQDSGRVNALSDTGGSMVGLSDTVWQAAVSIAAFIAGLFGGFSFVNDQSYSLRILFGPPLLCLAAGCIAVGGLNRLALNAAWRLYAKFAFGFALGYGFATWK
jgi:hypothetical protein